MFVRAWRRLACVFAIVAGTPIAVTAAPTIVEVHTAAPNVVVAELADSAPVNEDDFVSITTMSGHALSVDPSEYSVGGVKPAVVHRYTVTSDEDRRIVETGFTNVTLRHRIYLVLDANLTENTSYQVTTPSYGNKQFTFSSTGTYCESIHVNEIAYDPRATSSFANLGIYMGSGKSMNFGSNPPIYDILNDVNGSVVSSGLTAEAVRDDSSGTSGEYVYRLPIPKNLPDARYFISVRGFGRSRPFGVGDRYSREIAKLVTRGLYHQRCGIALEKPYTDYTRPVCHTDLWDLLADADVGTSSHNAIYNQTSLSGSPKWTDFSGGYHDAGDFDRRQMHTIIPILMLSYFDAFPTHFIDGQYDIPESNNGIPDFLDEALWGVKLWENLQIWDTNDSRHGGVRSGTGDAQPAYGYDDAATDPFKYTTYAVGATDEVVDRGSESGCGGTVTALSSGMFAQASRLLMTYAATNPAAQTHAADLLGRAKAAWDYLEKNNNVNTPLGRYLYAALQLYLATGEDKYHEVFTADAQQLIINGGQYPEQYLPGNPAAAIVTAHFISYLLPQPCSPTVNCSPDPTLAENLKGVILSRAEEGGYPGKAPASRPYPQAEMYCWGAATATGQYADVYAFATLFAKNEADRQRYYDAVSQYADYDLGLNPMSISYYTGVKEHFANLSKSDASFTGLGADEVQSPLHLDSYFTKYGVEDGRGNGHGGNPIGNVPGILIFGPGCLGGSSYEKAVWGQLFPTLVDDNDYQTIPRLRVWGDGRGAVYNAEFTTWQTIVWNVVMHGFLYNANATIPTPVCGNGICESGELTSCPNDCATVNTCGDGVCQSNESTVSCTTDCYCGNGTCETGETAASCPNDCATKTTPVCGNGTCETGETATSCPADCKGGVKGVCGAGESGLAGLLVAGLAWRYMSRRRCRPPNVHPSLP